MEEERHSTASSSSPTEEYEVVIAHDHFPQRGGAERVAEELARTFDAPIYTSFVGEGVRSEDVEVHDLFGSGLSGRLLSGDSTFTMLFRDLYYMTHWDNIPELRDYDVIIQSGNAPTWYVPSEEQTIVRYVHTPPRELYDMHSTYADSLKHTLYAHVMRTLYTQTHSYPDIYVANSELVARRCEQYYGIPRDEIEVVYPPIDVESYGPEHADSETDVEWDDFYFTFSRLYPGKNVDMVIKAFNELGDDYHLVVGGDGPEREKLESLGGQNIQFVGYVSEAEKRTLCARAKAGIFAATNEDFGMVPIEFFASGTPVLGVDGGYTKYQIMNGKNGYMFGQDLEEIMKAVKCINCHGVEWTPEKIREFSHKYGVYEFRKKMKQVVRKAQEQAQINKRDWQPP